MDFRITDHPRATVVEDDIFTYLVVEYRGGNGTVDVFRNVKGGCYSFHRAFADWQHFKHALPQTAEALEREKQEKCGQV